MQTITACTEYYLQDFLAAGKNQHFGTLLPSTGQQDTLNFYPHFYATKSERICLPTAFNVNKFKYALLCSIRYSCMKNVPSGKKQSSVFFCVA